MQWLPPVSFSEVLQVKKPVVPQGSLGSNLTPGRHLITA